MKSLTSYLLLMLLVFTLVSCGSDEEPTPKDDPIEEPEIVTLPFDYFEYRVALDNHSNRYNYFVFSAYVESKSDEGFYRYVGTNSNCSTGYSIADGKLTYNVTCNMNREGTVIPNEELWEPVLTFKIKMVCDIPPSAIRQPVSEMLLTFVNYNQVINVSSNVMVFTYNTTGYRVNSTNATFVTNTNDNKSLKVYYDWIDQP